MMNYQLATCSLKAQMNVDLFIYKQLGRLNNKSKGLGYALTIPSAIVITVAKIVISPFKAIESSFNELKFYVENATSEIKANEHKAEANTLFLRISKYIKEDSEFRENLTLKQHLNIYLLGKFSEKTPKQLRIEGICLACLFPLRLAFNICVLPLKMCWSFVQIPSVTLSCMKGVYNVGKDRKDYWI